MSYLDSKPPSGMDIDEDQRGRIIGSSVAILVMTITVVFLRLLSRRLSRAGLWWDDYLTIAASVFSILSVVLGIIEISNGWGRHIWFWDGEYRYKKARIYLMNQLIFEILITVAHQLAKFAVLLFYYRIFSIPRFRRLLVWIGFFTMAFLIAATLVFTFQCRPVHYAWDRFNKNLTGECLNPNIMYIAIGSVNVLENVVLFLLPIPLVWRLRTTRKQRVILSIIFILASCIIVISIIWTVNLSNVSQEDFTWNYVTPGVWCEWEPNVAVLCACIPSLRPLFVIVTQGVFKHSMTKHPLDSSNRASSRTRWSSSKGNSSIGIFSQLDQPEDLRPLGQGTTIRGGVIDNDREGKEANELPTGGINVLTEITWTTSDRLDYDDRLF